MAELLLDGCATFRIAQTTRVWDISRMFHRLSPSLPFSDKVIRHRACSLKDTAHATFAAELDPEFDRMCEEIKVARGKRGKDFILTGGKENGENSLFGRLLKKIELWF